MKKLFAVLLLLVGSAFAQTTGNLINPTGWNNIYYTNNQVVNLCCSGGPGPAMNQDTNTIRFAWGYSTTSQIIAINQVLSGTGLQIGGFNYSFGLQNDLNNWGGTRGTLIASASLESPSGKVLERWSQDYSNVNTGSNFVTQSGTVNFTNPYNLTDVGSFDVSFTGKDRNFWAGYYGPRVRDPQFTLNYTVSLPPVADWTFLVNENGSFTLTKQTEIRYGANGTYLYKMLDAGSYSCSNGQFGQDPLVGVGKACSVPTDSIQTTPTVTASGYTPLSSVVNNTAFNTVNNLNSNSQNTQTTQTQQAMVAAASQPAPSPPVAGPDPASQPPQPAAAQPQQPAPQQTQQAQQQQQQQNPVASASSGSPSPGPSPLQPGPSASPQQQAGGPAQSNNTQAASTTKSEKQTSGGGVSTAQAMAMFQTLSKATEKLNSQTVSKANDVAQAAVAQTEQTAMSVSAAAVSNSQSIAKDAVQASTTTSKTTSTSTSSMSMAVAQSSSSGPAQSVSQNTTSSPQTSNAGDRKSTRLKLQSH